MVAVEANPRPQLAVAEAHVEVTMHGDFAFEPDDDADDVVRRSRRHEVDDANPPTVTIDIGLEDERLRLIALLGTVNLRCRAQQPIAVPVAAEQLREASVGIDARQAQPVDRAAARDQRDRRRVADDSVLFEWGTHDGKDGARRARAIRDAL
jgi:hypothetical protein